MYNLIKGDLKLGLIIFIVSNLATNAIAEEKGTQQDKLEIQQKEWMNEQKEWINEFHKERQKVFNHLKSNLNKDLNFIFENNKWEKINPDTVFYPLFRLPFDNVDENFSLSSSSPQLLIPINIESDENKIDGGFILKRNENDSSRDTPGFIFNIKF